MLDRDPIHEARRQWEAHGWGDAATGMALVTSLTRVHQILIERIGASLRSFDLTFARFEVLRLLAFTSSGTMAMTRLGSLLQVHPTSVTSAVQRLEAQGFVTRSKGEEDRRVVLTRITPAGREVVEAATEAVNAVFVEPGLSSADAEAMIALLDTMRAEAGDRTSR